MPGEFIGVFSLCSLIYVCLGPCFVIQQEKAEMKRELWRIEDVMAGLSASKANYKITIDSVQNPGEKTILKQPTVFCHWQKPSQGFLEKLDLPTVDNKKKKSTCVCKSDSNLLTLTQNFFVFTCRSRKKISAFGVRPSSAFS